MQNKVNAKIAVLTDFSGNSWRILQHTFKDTEGVDFLILCHSKHEPKEGFTESFQEFIRKLSSHYEIKLDGKMLYGDLILNLDETCKKESIDVLIIPRAYCENDIISESIKSFFKPEIRIL